MKYKLKKPCIHCPFSKEVAPFLTKRRALEIAKSLEQSEFPCHKTLDYKNSHEGKETEETQHCAGALIVLEKNNQPSQMMRICERIGFYDRTILKMDSNVYDTLRDFINAQQE